ncbi:MAG: anhydro-N-acetylmuramic acid kinase [Rhodospirillaceae bacterium]|nr:anhydro-N-acetylmuramic acid kinase [Rhodospirillaceae bacterium]
MSGALPEGPVRALGMMSGTSLDGVDVALIETDGVTVSGFGPWLTTPYPDDLRTRLRAVIEGRDGREDAERALTAFHADAAEALLAEAGVHRDEVAVAGFHGHTVRHDPDAGFTDQIGDGAALARRLGIDVVNDFRSNDVAAGGQGAPLVPLFHAALARRSGLAAPLAVLNLGGVANVTWIGGPVDEDLMAFDTGPGCALIDDWVRRKTGAALDRDGRLARSGRVDYGALDTLLAHPYFDALPPKSLDRNAFDPAPVSGLSAGDGAATLVAFTAEAVRRALAHMPVAPLRWLVSGGGRHNPALMAALAERLGVPCDAVERVGWQGDALEAQAFGYLAVRSRRGLALSLPRTTGVPRPVSGGVFHPRSSRRRAM